MEKKKKVKRIKVNTAAEYFEKTAKKNPDTPKNISEAKTKLLYGGVGLRGERDKKKGVNNIGKESLKGGAIGAGVGATAAGLFSLATRRKVDLKTLKSMGKIGAGVGVGSAAGSALNYQGGRTQKEGKKQWNNLAKDYLKRQREDDKK